MCLGYSACLSQLQPAMGMTIESEPVLLWMCWSSVDICELLSMCITACECLPIQTVSGPLSMCVKKAVSVAQAQGT